LAVLRRNIELFLKAKDIIFVKDILEQYLTTHKNYYF